TAGLCTRFWTDAPQFFVRWELLNENIALPHMAATGVSGIDIYVLDNKNEYLFMGVGIPKGVQNTAVFKAANQQN
ncbi:MAG: SGNH/GDSL hydrolase N-terminal domain-containing protein, partial [Thermoflexibacteraceae bacterium]